MRTYEVCLNDGRIYRDIYADSPFAAKRNVYAMLRGSVPMNEMRVFPQGY